jgi:serine/threonine protein kinase
VTTTFHDVIDAVMSEFDPHNSSCHEVITLGAESYIALAYDEEGRVYCVKEIRSALGLLLDWNASRNKALGKRRRKDERRKKERAKIPYRKKADRLKSEYRIGKLLQLDHGPIVEMHGLQTVKWPSARLGFEIGHDLIMEYIPGHDLGEKKVTRSLTFEQKLDSFYQTTIALGYMHEHGFVHLDMKPSNVMWTDGRVRLIDFGVSVSKHVELSKIRGTSGFMAPEQMTKGVVDERTDVFGLGVTFNVVFGGHSLKQRLRKSRHSDRMNIKGNNMDHDRSLIDPATEIQQVPKLLDLVQRCTIPKRSDRVPNTAVVAQALREIAEEHDVALTDPLTASTAEDA